MKALTLSDDGLQFLEDGKPWTWRGTLDWPLFGRYLNEGPDAVRSIFRDRKSVGGNTVCLAAQLSWWPNLHPNNPAWWESWRPFVQLAAEEGVRLCLVVFCDTGTYPVSYRAHWERFYVTIGDAQNVTLLAMNQPGHTTQDNDHLLPVLPTLTTKPVNGFPPLLFARDNPMESGNPMLPTGDWCAYCSTRDEVKGYVEVGSSMWYVVNGWPEKPGEWTGTHRASVLFEGPHGKATGPWSDAGKWRQLARSLGMKGTAGGNFYSDQCSRAELLTGVERSCAVEFLGNIPTP